MTEEATVDQEIRQRERLVRVIAIELGATVAATGGKIERREERLVAELCYQPGIIWVLEFPVKIMILVKGEEWKGFYALLDEDSNLLSAVHHVDSNDVIWDLRPVDPDGRAILQPMDLSENDLQTLLDKLRQEGFTI